MKKLPVYKLRINEDDKTRMGVEYVALVDDPAIQIDWIKFSQQKDYHMKLSADKERRLIMGPLMVANMPIYRMDAERGEYYVTFDQETIYQIAQKFFRNGFMSQFNIMHDENKKVDGVYIFEAFMVDETRGLKAPKAFENISQGSWIATAKVDNDNVWQEYLATGKLRGFSVEGIFAMCEMVRTDEEILREIADIVTGNA